MSAPQTWTATLLHDTSHLLAEGPHWDPRTGLVSWVDIPNGELWASAVSTSAIPERIYHVNDSLGVAVPHLDGGWVCGVGGSVQLIVDGHVQARVELESEGARLNDGKVDPAGRFWVGSKGHNNEPGRGHLYRLGLDGSADEVLDGLTISNGLGWSPDQRTMYLTDSAVGNIYSFDFDVETGALDNQQVFVHLEPDEGFPDGLCVDAEGAIWTALWAGSAVRRYSPNGEHIGTVEVAASHVTSCTFVGAALNSLVITSAKDELPEEVLAAEPHAGSIFVTEVDVTGVVGKSCTVTTDGWRRTS